jgi:CDP-diacylglycerol--glycerol-3-phosphate 3-phosphatidyltransferase
MNTPTKITVARIIAIAVMLIGLFVLSFIPFSAEQKAAMMLGDSGINLIYLIICIIFIVASFTDFLDGYLARKNNQVTNLGKFLDPVADKLLVNSIVIFLLVPQSYTIGQMSFPLFCAIILICRDLVVDALRFIAASKHVVLAANYFGKIKTVLEMIAVPAILLNGWPFSYFDKDWGYFRIAFILVYLATLASLLSGIIYVVQNRNVLKEDKHE